MKRSRRPPVVLSVSGSDPGGGAGLEADLKTFQRHGVHGMAVATLLTVQNTLGVRRVRFLDPDFLAEQWQALFEDIRPDAIKIGALGSRAMVRRVARLLASPAVRGIPVVLDPVLGSTSGAPLMEPGSLPDLRRLLPLCRVVTPNLPEFEALFPARPGARGKMSPDPAGRLMSLGPRPHAVLLKGGHLPGPRSPDWLYDEGRVLRLPGARIDARGTHGTGCALASSIAAGLALGKSLPAACRSAKSFVAAAIADAPELGRGNGPIDLLGA